MKILISVSDSGGRSDKILVIQLNSDMSQLVIVAKIYLKTYSDKYIIDPN